MVATTMLQSLSIGAAGGSIASIHRELGTRLEVGPQSAGSYPGPVAYDLGGTEPTVTDADLVLGYLDPENYFGGRMLLNKEAAEAAIRERIAEPLGLETIEAAALIRRLIDEKMSSAIRKEVTLRGYRPSEFVVFAIGGAGPTHVAGYMGEIPRAVIFPFSPVFCAYGSSIMDVVHLYEQSQRMVLIEPVTQRPAVDFDAFNAVVSGLIEQARKEVAAEGLPWESALLSLELDMLYGGQIHSKRTSTPALQLESEEDVWRFYRQFEQEFSEAFSPLVVNLAGGVYIDTFVLRVTLPGKRVELATAPLEGPDPSAARSGARAAYWPETGEWAETPVFVLDRLRPGNRIDGPAIVESEYTTGVIPPGRRLTIEEHGLGVIENGD
jgi:N-methylhydantoinase A/oxoprolinase/acetone carboxylase beta subunit